MIGPIQGLLLDNARWSRRSRGRYGVVTLVILSLLTCKLIAFSGSLYAGIVHWLIATSQGHMGLLSNISMTSGVQPQ